ncbi:Integrase OS=Streptomyces microflavus OX=1919 GN=Smic_07850 PE=4 SV=1 [Streptomyces microflavus]
MLRRTLALSIAARPGGLLAAKIALKHISVATTEGYAAHPGDIEPAVPH